MLHRGYDIWITDDEGRRMPEYKMEVEGHNGKTVACYTPSESGKVCALHLHNACGFGHAICKKDTEGGFPG